MSRSLNIPFILATGSWGTSGLTAIVDFGALGWITFLTVAFGGLGGTAGLSIQTKVEQQKKLLRSIGIIRDSLMSGLSSIPSFRP